MSAWIPPRPADGPPLDELVSRGSKVRCPRMGGCGAWVDRLLVLQAEGRPGEALLLCSDCTAKARARR